MAQRRFAFIHAPEVLEHLDYVERKHHRLLEKEIDEQLANEPTTKTRNRKLLRQPSPFDATWELRCGPDNRYRVFYDVKLDDCTVLILAIGIKDRNRLFIGGEEFAP